MLENHTFFFKKCQFHIKFLICKTRSNNVYVQTGQFKYKIRKITAFILNNNGMLYKLSEHVNIVLISKLK